MFAVRDQASTIEILRRITSRLADADLTVAEANELVPLVQRLLDELGGSTGSERIPSSALPQAGL
jgi:hypothetical protein